MGGLTSSVAVGNVGLVTPVQGAAMSRAQTMSVGSGATALLRTGLGTGARRIVRASRCISRFALAATYPDVGRSGRAVSATGTDACRRVGAPALSPSRLCQVRVTGSCDAPTRTAPQSFRGCRSGGASDSMRSRHGSWHLDNHPGAGRRQSSNLQRRTLLM